jgi:hypothetical protein
MKGQAWRLQPRTGRMTVKPLEEVSVNTRTIALIALVIAIIVLVLLLM